jgi:hypothetical protein
VTKSPVRAVRRFSVEATTPASPDAVYRLLADAPSWARWAGPLITSAVWETEPRADTTGGVRRLGRPPFMVREEIVAAEPPHRHAYRLLSGQPVRSYDVDVRITPVGGSGDQLPHTGEDARTRVVWSGSVVALVPGTGWLVQRLLRRMLGGFARRLAAAAQTAGTAPDPGRPRP